MEKGCAQSPDLPQGGSASENFRVYTCTESSGLHKLPLMLGIFPTDE
jgi:hypothetical protein